MTGNHDSGREAVSWLATGAVAILGIVFIGFLVLAFENEPLKPILVVSGLLVFWAFLLWGLREKPQQKIEQEEAKWLGLFSKSKETTTYKLSRRRKPKIIQFGTNEPPDAERIREIKEVSDGLKNWAPPVSRPESEITSQDVLPETSRSSEVL